jgi:uncharacterized membrane protein YkoI
MRKSLLALGLPLLIAATACFGSIAASRDGRDSDQERARDAFERGEILPISEILAIALQHLPGDVVEVELDIEDDFIGYEIDVLTAAGRVREIEIDARTGAVLDIDD